MLCNIDIKNIAVIEDLTFEPGKKMSVLTGETGAGKSVIIDSVNLILGARTNKNLVRHGCERALVSAMFFVTDEIREILNNNGISNDDETLIITRDITADGKSVARVNGTMVTINFLREISHLLVNIHGQHDNQDLLNPSKHIDYLDSYGDNKQLLLEYTALYKDLKDKEHEYKMICNNEQERMSRIDLLTYQTDELLKADLKPGEKEELIEEYNLIANSEKISQGVNGSYSVLYDSEKCTYDTLSTAISTLASIASFNDELSDIYDRLNEASYTIQDCVHELRSFAENIEFDPQRLNEISERIDYIKRLERKYGGSIESCLEYLNNAQNELDILKNSDIHQENLLAKIDEITIQLTDIAKKMSTIRKKAAKRLSDEIKLQLNELDMEKATFEVDVTCSDALGAKGFDNVEFIFSANPGLPMKSLTEIASGGELSRVMLALKSILADSDNTSTLIFDEIDTGVSGNAAQKIAKKLSLLGKKKQVICISHQPQLAAAADSQFKIEKIVNDGHTKTKIEQLNGTERVEAIAKMIDGDELTKTSIEHAREMIERGY